MAVFNEADMRRAQALQPMNLGLLGAATGGALSGGLGQGRLEGQQRSQAADSARQRMAQGLQCMTTNAFATACIAFTGMHPQTYHFQAPEPQKVRAKTAKKLEHKPLKSESKAQELLRDLIGFDQWEVYRKTNRVLVRQGKLFWIIGNVFGSYNKFRPFIGKPDVVRIDNSDKLYATSFCVDQGGGEQTPYTDKVVTFATHLMADLKEFMKHANRIEEKNFNTMKECAVWEIQ